MPCLQRAMPPADNLEQRSSLAERAALEVEMLLWALGKQLKGQEGLCRLLQGAACVVKVAL